MRYVIYGAGAVGGAIGAALHIAGKRVLLIARGAHLDAIREHGLTLQTPARSQTLRIPAAGSPGEAGIEAGDAIVLAMKGQDTESALRDLVAAAPAEVAVVCAQNGVENERLALRRFRDVYGALAMMPADFMQPGVVRNPSTPTSGIVDVGRYPHGVDATAAQIASDLSDAGFSSRAVPDIMRWKHSKILYNLRAEVTAFCTPGQARERLADAAVAEAEACMRAAGIDWAGDEEVEQRRGGLVGAAPIEGERHQVSFWQSLARGSGLIESDFLSGEIVLLARLHGAPCPINAALQEISTTMAREHARPASLDPAAVFALAQRRAAAAPPEAISPVGPR